MERSHLVRINCLFNAVDIHLADAKLLLRKTMKIIKTSSIAALATVCNCYKGGYAG
ncbi:hypothetical protein WMN79_11665 [Pseudescherichia vulneris]